MEKLSVEYIDSHRNEIHTYESFGRTIADLILQSARSQLNNGELNEEDVTFNAEVKVFPITAKGCIGAEVCVPFSGCTRVHINVS